MVSEITRNIKISVKSAYQMGRSIPDNKSYIHAYWVKIENLSEVNVKLISRYWLIKDSGSEIREVKGDGVVGAQPVILPGESHAYSSWCPLTSPVGTMEGHYTLMNVHNRELFDVKIPRFKLIADFIEN